MGWNGRGTHNDQTHEPINVTDEVLAAQTLYRLGPDGDRDPGSRFSGDTGNVIENLVFKNLGSTELWVGRSAIRMFIGDELGQLDYTPVPAGEAVELLGVNSEIDVWNAAAADNGRWTVDGAMGIDLNRGAKNRAPAFGTRGGHPGHDPELSARVIGQANGTASVTLKAPAWAGDGVTVGGIKLWAQAAPTTAGTYTIAITGGGNNLLATATFDLTGLTAVTVEPLTLTATTAHLDLDPGDDIVITVTSDNGDLAGGDFFVGFQATAR